MKKVFFLNVIYLMCLFVTSTGYSYGTAVSNHPLEVKAKNITLEATGLVSQGAGVGMQARFVQRLEQNFTYEAGAGIATGKRTNRFFAGADYQIFPDYLNQPRVSLKTTLMNSKEFGVRRNVLSVAPTVSKGFSFWGQEAFPYASLPVGLSFDYKENKYNNVMNLNAGITTVLPWEEFNKLVGFFEGTLNLSNSYSGFMTGVSYAF